MLLTVQKILSIFLLIILIIGIAAFWQKGALPAKEKVLKELMQEPMQEPTSKENFSFSYRGTNYNVKPLAEYEIQGLVVTHNNINAWYNFYHDENSVNIKDLCVIWGTNISANVYTAMNFKSGEWTCYPDWKWPLKRELIGKYRNNQLSNNHLFTDNPKIQDLIRRTNVGDQVYIKGQLAAYAAAGTPENYYRGSSLSRDDTGNHACEVVFVDEYKILKKGTPAWYLLYRLAKIFLAAIIIIKFILLIIEANIRVKSS